MRPQQTIVERLDFVAKRVPGLKFTPPTQLKPGDEQFYGCFMSCDMYYIEIKVDQSHQSVKDVIISHGNSADGISCPVLRKVLAEQDFETFAKHLTGLHSIYLINTSDKKVKQRAYPALTALETDLTILYEHQRRRITSCHDLVHKSPIGFMDPRRGGLPVKLTYFITPYDLVDADQKSFINLTVNNIVDKNLGLSATVEIEGSSPHKIQMKSLIMQSNSSLPIYAPFNSQNSEKLPAQFVLKLSQPLPMLNTSISQIMNDINEPATIKEFLSQAMTKSKESIINLIARQELDLNKGLFGRTAIVDCLKGYDGELCDLKKQVYSIKLPDQHHTYHIIDTYLERPDGVYIDKIPFTHPTSIPSILKVLRQQALFNFVIGSCIRRNKANNNATNNPTSTSSSVDENGASKPATQQVSNIFDVLPVNLNNICIAFEHPSRESLATLEIDFKDISCQLYALDKESVCSDEFATKILQKCWSIPITLRSVLRKCNETRLALLEDSNKRRERELQELLANNNSTNHQQSSLLPPTNSSSMQETLLQSTLNPASANDKATHPRDLNSIAEFLSSKVSNNNKNNNISTTVDGANQGSKNASSETNRTNLLKKFSCKPKVKQSQATTKSQTGNKILSLMLKRQNSTTTSLDDPIFKGPVTKKVKTKNAGESSGSTADAPPPPALTTTKLISPDVAMAARLANMKQQQQQTKQTNIGSNSQNQKSEASVSLIKAPKPVITASSTNPLTSQINVALSSNNLNAQSNQAPVNNIRLKAQLSNGISTPNAAGKPRKSSIGAVLDRLVGNVTPEQQSNLMSQLTSNSDSGTLEKSAADVSKLGTNVGGAKTKVKPPGGDQFAIKQGSSGGGLKLTVTKTKPTLTTPSSSTSSLPSLASITSASPAASNSTTSASTTPSNTSSSATSSAANNSSKQSDASKVLELGSATPSIRYTIPKISKTQQNASQSSSSSQANASDINASSHNDPAQPQLGDDSNNPSSSANQSSAAPSSTTTAKRTTSNPFNRNVGTNRNPVSSSTHPPNRTTSNPLAGASSNRPSTSSSNSNNSDNPLLNRISSSSNQNQQQQRQPIMNRSVNLLPQPHFTTQSSPVSSASVAGPAGGLQAAQQRLLNPSAIMTQQQAAVAAAAAAAAPQLIRQQPSIPQMFPLRFPSQAPGLFANSNDLNLIAANQVALLNQQQQFQQQAQQLQLQQQVQQHIQQQQLMQSQPSLLQQPQLPSVGLPLHSRVSSSSDGGSGADQDNVPNTISQSALPSSTPSSPTECGQVETVAPPPLIPIDSLEEAQPASPEVDHDDESDRLSIVDMNEHNASDSLAGTPRESGIPSPMAIVQDSSSPFTASSSTSVSRGVDSSQNTMDQIATPGLSASQQQQPSLPPPSSQPKPVVPEPEANAEAVVLPSEPVQVQADDRVAVAGSMSESLDTTQSPHSSTAAASTTAAAATSNLI